MVLKVFGTRLTPLEPFRLSLPATALTQCLIIILPVIISQQQRNKYTRNYDITKPQHSAVVRSQSFFQEILRKHHYN